MLRSYFGLFFIFLAGCQSPKPDSVCILSPNAVKTNSFKEVDLDAYQSTDDLFHITDSLWCAETGVVWTFREDSCNFKIQVFGFCYDFGIRWDPNHADFIKLYATHFVKNGTLYPYDSLKTVMLRDLLNYGQNPEFAQSPEKAFLSLTVQKSDTLKTIKQVLRKVALAHIAIPGNKHLSLVVGKAIEPPPPPPGYLRADN